MIKKREGEKGRENKYYKQESKTQESFFFLQLKQKQNKTSATKGYKIKSLNTNFNFNTHIILSDQIPLWIVVINDKKN